jgi:hypothetical protein
LLRQSVNRLQQCRQACCKNADPNGFESRHAGKTNVLKWPLAIATFA